MNLIELMTALSLASVVLVGGLDVLTVSVRQQIVDARQTRVQSNAFLGWRAAEVEIREATQIMTPAGVGTASDDLSGCLNYDSRLGAGAAGALDPTKPVAGFYFCESGGNLYYYTAPVCPFTVGCGAAGGTVVAGGVSHLAGVPSYFSAPSPGVVRVGFQASDLAQVPSLPQTQTVDFSVAYNAAAGTNQ